MPDLNQIQGKTLLDVEFDKIVNSKSVRQLVTESFHTIANSNSAAEDGGSKNLSTAASKMMHAAINTDLFVPWDGDIRWCYSVGGSGRTYVNFLETMQHIAKTLSSDEINSLIEQCRYNNSLAKILDEFNFMAYKASRIGLKSFANESNRLQGLKLIVKEFIPACRENTGQSAATNDQVLTLFSYSKSASCDLLIPIGIA